MIGGLRTLVAQIQDSSGQIHSRANEMASLSTAASTWKQLFTVSESGLGGLLSVIFAGPNRVFVCGTDAVAEMDSTGKHVKTFKLGKTFFWGKAVSGLESSVRYSRSHNAMIFGTFKNLDVTTGITTRFKPLDWTGAETNQIDWLGRDVVK